ncbi:hypothetical protein MYSTI_00149 [Myxococcus stipitatus DSM 14675]|uniref:Uncharacterized protein n=1 Tax=Myxococcus stipitatus (strain DSM 14675 / JCM 12634 / Mx s8) TaxID=1278073 RepID=L7TZV5_MYXSD|nr:TIGR02996 domain-containing protein [Myxococcus stipitatus]AGC41508.1 hypothetical protein MYSTI_00149 [Myxococcus stipitatus DSM 14675]
MSDTLELHLERAEAALARWEGDAALGHLLEAWQECRAEPIIALIHRLSEFLYAGLPPLDSFVFEKSEEGARHPMDLPLLLEGLLRNATSDGLCIRLRVLDLLRRRFPADPRMVPVVLASTRLPDAEHVDNLRMHSSMLMYIGPPYDVEPLRELKARLPRDIGREAARLDKVIRMGERWAPPVLSEPVQSRCEVLRQVVEARIDRVSRSAATRDALLARIHAAPADDEPRRVLADLLLGQGDPLGELISLQCESEPDEARIIRLLEVHGARWEAALGPYVERGHTRFERGFPVAVQARHHPLVGFPLEFVEPGAAWSTVEEIRMGMSGLHEAMVWGLMLQSPALRHVKALARFPGMAVEALTAPGESSLRRVELTNTEGVGVEKLAALPRLEWLKATTDGPRFVVQCLESSLASRLEYFEASRRPEPYDEHRREPGSVAWRMVLDRGAEVPVSVTLENPDDAEDLVAILRIATRFSTHALRVSFRFGWMPAHENITAPELAPLIAQSRALLEEAASAYAHVIWDVE